MRGWIGYLVVGLLGATVGGVELAKRYRDDPMRSIRKPAALFYLLINIMASIAALSLLRVFHWDLGLNGLQREVAQILVAGVGALTLFRAKLFSPAYRGETFRWSPGGILEQLLAVADDQVDRDQAVRRATVAREVMRTVSFERAAVPLPAYALALRERASEEDQRRLGDDVRSLVEAGPAMTDPVKAQLLGIAVMRFTGPVLLEAAVQGLGDEIARPAVVDLNEQPAEPAPSPPLPSSEPQKP
jgi:hypothetical protein